jgi:hypothetical protein
MNPFESCEVKGSNETIEKTVYMHVILKEDIVVHQSLLTVSTTSCICKTNPIIYFEVLQFSTW